MTVTSIEQSKKLIELGLDENTADMVILHEEPYETSDSKFDGIHQIVCVPFKEYNKKYREKYKNISYFPAWSLGALLKLMPSVSLSTPNKSFVDYYCTFEDKTGDIINDFCADDPLDAAYDMVCWLIENGYLEEENDKN